MTAHQQSDLGQRISFYGLQDAEADFPVIAKAVDRHANVALQSFYQKIGNTPTTSAFFSSQSMMDRARNAQLQHWRQIFNGRLTREYEDRATNIGNVHARIGLEPLWYIGGYAMVLEQVVSSMLLSSPYGRMPGFRKMTKAIGSLIKVAMLDMDLALSAYFVKAEENVRTVVVSKIGAALDRLANGDLTVEISDLPEVYSELAMNFNKATAQLREVLQSVSESVESIHTGSDEISSASDDLSRRTEQQAASLEETAAAMTEITATVQSSAAGADHANKLAMTTQADAQESSKVVAAAVSAMGEIEKSSKQITQISEVIEKIAFQTNLLALNASVEAAHAGDAGRAFEVVANEVRALAQRSAEAAQEIGQIISTSSQQVENGVELVGEAGKALDRIIGQVSEVSGLVSQIAMAAEQQSTALAQVNTAVTEMDKVTQQNAAMVEQSNAAARSLAEEATDLSGLVGKFSIGRSAGPKLVASNTPKSSARMVTRAPRVARSLALKAQPANEEWNEF